MKAAFPCRICGTPTAPKAWGGGECPSCESVSVITLPTLAEIAAFYARYNDGYTGGGTSKGCNLKRYANRYLALVRGYGGAGTLIDVGSSNSPFPNVAAAAGFRTTMLDFERPRGLQPDVEYIRGSLNDELPQDLRGRRFDVVTCWSVMEHVPDSHAAARRLVGLLKPGSLLLMSTPEIGTALSRHAAGRSPWFYPPEHLTLLSPKAFELLFQPLGCERIAWGHLEFSLLRYALRYGQGVAEAGFGWPLKRLAPASWQRLREHRPQRFKGVAYFAYRLRA